jgi:HD-GYP domain-containing protein (c-di-GMP phosphodiesterase class II)
MLKNIDFPWPIAKVVYQHHERIDGSGYPLGIKGDDILIESKILSVADVVEAMASHRPYRPALGIQKALNEIKKQRGHSFDSIVVDACLTLFNEKRYIFR